MGLVTDASKELVRSRVALEELLREYNVVLTPVGRRLRALCPLHAERTPSFYVDVEKQVYHCFGCQEHGDVFRFIQRMHQVDFPQALELLAQRAGVALEYTTGGSSRRRGEGIVELYEVLEEARKHYNRFLLDDPGAEIARRYLLERGIERASWEKFSLGFSPPDWDHFLRHAQRAKIPVELVEKAGLARRRDNGSGHYDYFRGRVMFPIPDPQGRTIGFGARTLGSDVPKYLNTAKTALFDKSQVLYGLPQCRMGLQREGRIAIVEGYTDAIMAHQAGLDFFVASLGTAFTAENARRIGRLAPRVVLVFDGDAAGQKASERSLDLLVAENLDVRVYTVRNGKDPCDAILALGGPEFYKRIVEESVGLLEFKWRRTMESANDEGAPALKSRALDEFLELLAKVPNVVARKLYIREYSEKLNIPEADFEARAAELSRRGGARVGATSARSAPLGSPRGGVSPAPDTKNGDRAQRELEEIILECALALPQRVAECLGRVGPEFFRIPSCAAVARAMERRLERGACTAAALLEDLEDSDAARLVERLVGRSKDSDGNPSNDYEELWTRVQQDLERNGRRRRLEELKAHMLAAKVRGATEEFESLRKGYMDALREAKKGSGG
jgi:DNA primase